MKQTVDLSQQQIQQAAQAGVTLLNTPGAVNVPSTMSITGVTQVLHAFLLGIAEGRLAVIDLTKQAPLPIQASQTPAEPENPETWRLHFRFLSTDHGNACCHGG
jgi:hypothetical protein